MRSDPDAERAVLAACLTSPTARAEARRHITGADLDEPAHETIWDAMARLDRHGKTVDPVTVLAVVRPDRSAVELLPDIVTAGYAPTAVAEHAAIIRSWATKRRIEGTARAVLQHALEPARNASGYAASVANQFAAIRDSGITDDATSRTLDEVLADPDDDPDWLIPGLLERRDRLILTGEEGMGKSLILRQIAILAAAGLDPWDTSAPRFDPIKVTIIDCENTERQIRRVTRPVVEFATRYGDHPGGRVLLNCTRRMDITADRDLARIHHELDASNPDLVVIGPLYRLVPRAIQTDDEAAPVLAALDTIRDRGIALMIEAHSGHTLKGSHRDMRPRGSSALLGWPEFGYGMRDIGARGYCDLVAWRGNRTEREFPQRLRRADGFRWVPHEDPRGVGDWSAKGIA